MREVKRVEIAAKARALVWIGGELCDLAAGWVRYPLDGSPPVRRYSGYGATFDAAEVSPGGDVSALVSSTGTKALILREGRLVREVNRSYYHVNAYRYPLALFTLPAGRTGIVHCPAAYNRLEIEDAITGELLTAAPEREPRDVFHSRLAVSASGRYLLSAGWVWHPWGCLMVYDLERALQSPEILDTYGDAFDLRGLGGADDASTGAMALEWPDLATGTAESSIVWDKAFSGPARIAIDTRRTRFAVTDGQKITVVTVGSPER